MDPLEQSFDVLIFFPSSFPSIVAMTKASEFRAMTIITGTEMTIGRLRRSDKSVGKALS